MQLIMSSAIFKKLIILCVFFTPMQTNTKELCDIQPVYSVKRDLNIGIVLNECKDSRQYAILEDTLVNSAIWTINRLNQLDLTVPLKLGLTIYKACTTLDVYGSFYNLFHNNFDSYLLGVVTLKELPNKIKSLSTVLDINTKTKSEHISHLLKATLSFIEASDWHRNFSIITSTEEIAEEFISLSRNKNFCVFSSIIVGYEINDLKKIKGPTVIFAQSQQISKLLTSLPSNKSKGQDVIFAPTDHLQITGLPEGSFVLQPLFLESSPIYKLGTKIIPTPLHFELAGPIINLVQNVSLFFVETCNETLDKISCFLNNYENYRSIEDKKYTPSQILRILKLESLANQFLYKVYRVDGTVFDRFSNQSDFEYLRSNSNFQTYTKVFTYNIFDESIYFFENVGDYLNSSNYTSKQCSLNYCNLKCLNGNGKVYDLYPFFQDVHLRLESWVFAALSISLLGCIFCFAILFYFFLRICKKDIFEGNPTLTILLLLSVFCMYVTVIPFSLVGYNESYKILCSIRYTGFSLVFAFTFSLLLSRCIILSTLSNGLGFMAHVSGFIQTFLCVFIFAVQIALNMQIIKLCPGTSKGQKFFFIHSYNVLLLSLLLCISPFIRKSQRNYKEGKFFLLAILLTAVLWSFWITIWWLYEDWEDAITCFGVISTASIFLGTIFIPRTYMMTVSVARDRFASALPSLTAAANAMDIYRARNQPVYDTVNVAAIGASSDVPWRNPSLEQPDLYSCPAMPDDFRSPIASDKLTRF